jgi:hypothetical protein
MWRLIMARKNISFILIWGIIFNFLFPSGMFAAPASNPGFGEVEKMLDEGGNFYFYCNTKGALKQVMEHMKRIFSGANTAPDVKNAVNSIDQVIDTLGFYDIEDIGMSSVPVEDHFQSKSFIRIPREKRGILKVVGAKPHPCKVLEYAPKETQLLFSMDLNAKELLFLIRDCFLKGGGQNALMEFDKAIDNFNKNLSQMSGKEVTLQDLAASLDEEIALLIDIDPVMNINIPMGPSGSSQLPSPRFALMIRVKDASLYEILFETVRKNGLAQNETQEGNIRKVLLPAPPNPFYMLQPVLACDGQYFIATTQGSFLDKILETKKNGSGLKEAEEYKNIMKGMPSEGNCFIFISQNAFKTLQDIFSKFKELAEMNMGAAERSMVFHNFLYSLKGDITMGLASVRVNRENGIWEISKKQNNNPGATSVAAGMGFAGILTAIAVPGFLRARENSRTETCMENLIKLDGAKEQWALENNKQNGAEVKMEDLVGEDLFIRRKPVCPRGGSYTLGVIGENPTCSCGTKLPD